MFKAFLPKKTKVALLALNLLVKIEKDNQNNVYNKTNKNNQ